MNAPIACSIFVGLAIGLQPTRLDAQHFNIAATAGVLSYSLAGDQSFFTYGLQARYAVGPIFQVGILGSTAHIGSPLSAFAAPGTDEQLWRFAATMALSTSPMPKLALGVRGMLGVLHSSGLIYQGPPEGFEPYWQFVDAPTSVTYGGGLAVEIGPFSRLRGLIQGNFWIDHLYGGSSVDTELLFGVGLDF